MLCMQRGRRSEIRVGATTHVTKCTTGTYLYDRMQLSGAPFFATGIATELRSGLLRHARARQCPAAHSKPPLLARLEGYGEGDCGGGVSEGCQVTSSTSAHRSTSPQMRRKPPSRTLTRTSSVPAEYGRSIKAAGTTQRQQWRHRCMK